MPRSTLVAPSLAAATLGSVLAGVVGPPTHASTGPDARPAPGVNIEQAASPTATPQFKVDVNLVTIDVIPRETDSDRFVADLQKGDFDVLEDGVKQDVSSLVLVHGGRTYNVALPPPAAAIEGIILPTSRAARDEAGRIFMILVDDLHLEPTNSHHVRQLIKKISSTLLHEGDMVAMISTGPSAIEIEMTYDRKRVDGAVGKIVGHGMTATDIIQGAESLDGPATLRYRAHTAFWTVYEMLGQLEQIRNRRKAVLYVSQGYDFDPYPEGRQGRDTVQGGRFSDPRAMVSDEYRQKSGYDVSDPFMRLGKEQNKVPDADLALELLELTRAANRANVSFYTIDPRGLAGELDFAQLVDPTETRTTIQKTVASLRVLAENTGGLAVVNSNDFDKALKQIDAETSDYYVLGYYSSNPDPTKRTRQVEVKVRRENVKARARSSYSIKETPKKEASKP